MQKSVEDLNFRFGIKITDQGRRLKRLKKKNSEMLLFRKSNFSQKVTVHKDQKSPFIVQLF